MYDQHQTQRQAQLITAKAIRALREAGVDHQLPETGPLLFEDLVTIAAKVGCSPAEFFD